MLSCVQIIVLITGRRLSYLHTATSCGIWDGALGGIRVVIGVLAWLLGSPGLRSDLTSDTSHGMGSSLGEMVPYSRPATAGVPIRVEFVTPGGVTEHL